jgi:Flp pilus assembly protein TadD
MLTSLDKTDGLTPYLQSIAGNPARYDVLRSLGERYLAIEALGDAAKAYRRSLCIFKSAEALYKLAVIYRKMGLVDDAVHAMSCAVALDIDRSDLMSFRGSLFFFSGAFSEAVRWYGRASHLSPNSTSSRRGWAAALLKSGAVSESRVVLSELVALLPSDPEVLRNIGAACHADNRLSEAFSA